jgi:hypothetical protein
MLFDECSQLAVVYRLLKGGHYEILAQVKHDSTQKKQTE